MTSENITKVGTGDDDSSTRIASDWSATAVTDYKELSGVLRIGSFRDAKNVTVNVQPNISNTKRTLLMALMSSASSALLAKVKETIFTNANDDIPTLEQRDKKVGIAEFLVTDSIGKKHRFKIGFPYVSPFGADPNTGAALGLSALDTHFNDQTNCDVLYFLPGQTKVEYLGSYSAKMD